MNAGLRNDGQRDSSHLLYFRIQPPTDIRDRLHLNGYESYLLQVVEFSRLYSRMCVRVWLYA